MQVEMSPHTKMCVWSGRDAALTCDMAQQERVHTLPYGTIYEGLAGQRLVKGIFQGIAAFDLSAGHDVVYQVALRLHVLCSCHLCEVQDNTAHSPPKGRYAFKQNQSLVCSLLWAPPRSAQGSHLAVFWGYI